MELYNSKILILLIEQYNKRKQDYLTLQKRLIFKEQINMYCNNVDNSNISRIVYDGNVDNELCDMIRGMYDNDFNINVTNSNTINNENIYDITIDDMIKIVQDSNNRIISNTNTNNDKLVDLQIQLAMLWRIITMIKKSNTNNTILQFTDIDNFNFIIHIKQVEALI